MARELGVTSPLAEGDPSLALGTSTMNLLELTAAYAGVAGNAFPVEPHAFPAASRGLVRLAVRRQGQPVRRARIDDMKELLRKAVNAGTGRAARLSIPNFGKTGTTQDNRDALFVGLRRRSGGRGLGRQRRQYAAARRSTAAGSRRASGAIS